MAERRRASALGGATRVAAVFGDPVEHSLSPVMHNAAYAALGLDRIYIAFHVKPLMLAAALRAVPALGIIGINLTVPHKEHALRMVAKLSVEARMLGAINCIVNRPSGLYGDNTDARGLERDLGSLSVALKNATAVVIGAGGAAVSAVVACLRRGVNEVVIANRTPARAAALVRRLTTRLPRPLGGAALSVRGLDALADAALLGRATIIINATPMGLTQPRFTRIDYAQTQRECFFFDLIYAAQPTAFLRPAIALGRRAADGAGMLVSQGELAFELFNGVAPPPGVMRRALWERLSRGDHRP
ncbi:MAG: shikimate dehydrogenase [Candidatus Binataceae bacterium]